MTFLLEALDNLAPVEAFLAAALARVPEDNGGS